MAAPLPALDFLSKASDHAVPPVVAVFGDEPYLKRRAVKALKSSLAAADDDLECRQFPGPKADWRDVRDELATVSLFGSGRRLAIVEDADDFVRRFRPNLEDFVADPLESGVLILVVTTWPKNTRLFKSMAASSALQIDCKTPTKNAIVSWLRAEAKTRYAARLSADAADQMIEIVGLEMGILEQELDKLSLVAGQKAEISVDLVREMVGGWRAKTVWEMLDAAYEGRTDVALLQLQRLIGAGEHPVAILGQISSSLRRFAAAARIYVDAEKTGKRIPLATALQQAGLNNPYVLNKAEKQLKRLGRDRAHELYGWLLEVDLAIKGPSSAPDRARLELERLILRIAA